MKSIYIIGAVTFATEIEKSYFDIIQKYFENLGYYVINPLRLCEQKKLTDRIECLELILPKLIECTDVCILETSNKSYDSRLEIDLVKNLRKHTLHYITNIEIDNLIFNNQKGI